MKRVLLTGSSGFIGRACLDALAQGGWQVHAVDRRPIEGLPEPVEFHVVDLLDIDELRGLLREVRPTHLLHLAWTGARPVYASLENFRWVRGSLCLFEEFAAAGGERAVSLGSCAEYVWDEVDCQEGRTPLSTSTAYGVCKGSLGRLFSSFCRQTNLSGAWPRAFFLYGPYENRDRFVASVITSLLSGKPARCTHGEQVRDFLYSRDLADALVMLLDSDFEGPVNVASGSGVTLAEIARAVAAKVGRQDLLRLGALEAPRNEAARVVADTTRLREETGWQPVHDLGSGLDETIAWWREHLGV